MAASVPGRVTTTVMPTTIHVQLFAIASPSTHLCFEAGIGETIIMLKTFGYSMALQCRDIQASWTALQMY